MIVLPESLAIAVADRVRQTTTRQSVVRSVFIRANIAVPPYSRFVVLEPGGIPDPEAGLTASVKVQEPPEAWFFDTRVRP